MAPASASAVEGSATVVEARFDRRLGRWPIVVDCGGDAAGLRHAIDSAEPDGIVQSVSYYPEDLTGLPLGKMYTRGLDLCIGRVHSAATAPAVIRLAQERRLRVDRMPRTTVPWDDARERFLDPAIKLVVTR